MLSGLPRYARREAEQIRTDEGFSNRVYLDTLGHKTIGVGHLLPKTSYPVGFPFSRSYLEYLFAKDLEIAIDIVEDIASDEPMEVKRILLNMAFNLGKPRLLGFKKMLAAIKKQDYKKAAVEMKDSKWYDQVGNRSKRLVKRMRLAKPLKAVKV